MVFLLAFGLFAVAVAAMGVGVMFSGRYLSGSCGGMSAKGEAIGDCSCARKEADLCTDGPDQELVDIAELGWPMRRERRNHPPKAGGPADERIEV